MDMFMILLSSLKGWGRKTQTKFPRRAGSGNAPPYRFRAFPFALVSSTMGVPLKSKRFRIWFIR
jgi:hypothetical protein